MGDKGAGGGSDPRVDVGLPLDGEGLLETFPRAPSFRDHVDLRTLPERPAETVPAGACLRPALAAAYPHDPYTHQAAALDALADGDHVVVATSTDSGKTDVYALQAARNHLDSVGAERAGARADPGGGADAATVYLISPTKALARDQCRQLRERFDDLGLELTVGVYDGDTESGAPRRRMREGADVIVSNFMGVNTYLHDHERWARFFRNCELVAVDESHTYTGVQGMHAAWIVRRLRRVLSFYGADPQFVLTSATVGNPGEHAAALVDEPVTVVDADGSPRGARDLALWDPPPAGGDDGGNDAATDAAGERVPASVEAPRVLGHLAARGVQTLTFTPSRKLAELSVGRARSFVDEHHHAYDVLPGELSLAAYHAGLGRERRHALEHQFRTGRLDGLASTSALELGINVGEIDATALLGYPGSRQSFWQRIGRAGRDGGRSLAVLVADHRTLDQYVLEHPEYLLENDVEDAVVDTANDAVFAEHVRCAADELPLDESDAGDADDAGSFAERDRLERAVRMWRRAGQLEGDLAAGASYSGPPRPQTDVNLYATSAVEYHVRTPDHVPAAEDPDLEPLSRSRAYRDYHEGAVRVHGGQQYEVIDVDHAPPQPSVTIEPVDVPYYTRTRREVTVLDAASTASREVNGFTLHRGEGTVLVHHASYDQVAIEDNRTIARGLETGLPPLEMETQLCWVEVPDDVATHLFRAYAGEDPAGHAEQRSAGGAPADEMGPAAHVGYAGALHAAEHAMIKTAPLELLVDKNDLGGLSTLVLDGHLAAAPGADEDRGGGDSPGSVAAAEAAIAERQRGHAGERPTSGWFVYDGVEGGLGFSWAIYEQFEALAARARDSLADCGCGRAAGCPACTMDANCGNDNAPLHRDAAIDVFEHLLGAAALPDRSTGDEPADPGHRPAVFFS